MEKEENATKDGGLKSGITPPPTIKVISLKPAIILPVATNPTPAPSPPTSIINPSSPSPTSNLMPNTSNNEDSLSSAYTIHAKDAVLASIRTGPYRNTDDTEDMVDYEDDDGVIDDGDDGENRLADENVAYTNEVINVDLDSVDERAGNVTAVVDEVSDSQYPGMSEAGLEVALNTLDIVKNKYSIGNYMAIRRVIFNVMENRTMKNILIIGLGFNRKLSHEITFGSQLNELQQCLDNTGHRISNNVARDTIRAFFIEHFDKNTLVHSVTNCSDSYRNSLEMSHTEMNFDINSSRFVKKLVTEGWSFNHIYIDHYRMNHAYIVTMLGKGFFKSLVNLATSSVLQCIGEDLQLPKIFLPFVAHTFHTVHSMESISNCYDISYMSQHEANATHHLYAATNSTFCEAMLAHYDLTMDNQERYITTTKNVIKNYMVGILLNHDKLTGLLSDISNITDLRFIVLSLKNNVLNTNNLTSTNYYSLSTYNCNKHNIVPQKMYNSDDDGSCTIRRKVSFMNIYF